MNSPCDQLFHARHRAATVAKEVIYYGELKICSDAASHVAPRLWSLWYTGSPRFLGHTAFGEGADAILNSMRVP